MRNSSVEVVAGKSFLYPPRKIVLLWKGVELSFQEWKTVGLYFWYLTTDSSLAPLLLLLLGKLGRKPGSFLAKESQMFSLYWREDQTMKRWPMQGALTWVPLSKHHRTPSQRPLPVLSRHFQICFEACPALSRKPHYVSNKSLYTLSASVCHHQFWHLNQILGGSVHPPPSGCHMVERKEVYERERMTGELAAGKWKRWAVTGHLVQDNAQDFYIQKLSPSMACWC